MNGATIAGWLEDWRRGDARGLSLVVTELYPQLRRAAAACLRRESRAHTLQSTALVHEAYVQLAEGRPVRCQEKGHFLGIAARLMRQILIQAARRRQALKRGGAARATLLDDNVAEPRRTGGEEALAEAMERLRRREPRRHLVIEMHYRSGVTVQEIARLTQLSARTVERELSLGRAWLQEAVYGDDAD